MRVMAVLSEGEVFSLPVVRILVEVAVGVVEADANIAWTVCVRFRATGTNTKLCRNAMLR